MSALEGVTHKLTGEITSVNIETEVIAVVLDNGMAAEVAYSMMAQGGISPKVGGRFMALADMIEETKISPYGFMAISQ